MSKVFQNKLRGSVSLGQMLRAQAQRVLSPLLRRRLHWTKVIRLLGEFKKLGENWRSKALFCLSHFNFSVKNHEQKSVLPGITHLDRCSGQSLMFPSISILAQSGFDFDNLIEIPRITVQGETRGSFTSLESLNPRRLDYFICFV